jgi:hypothetical protein
VAGTWVLINPSNTAKELGKAKAIRKYFTGAIACRIFAWQNTCASTLKDIALATRCANRKDMWWLAYQKEKKTGEAPSPKEVNAAISALRHAQEKSDRAKSIDLLENIDEIVQSDTEHESEGDEQKQESNQAEEEQIDTAKKTNKKKKK